MSDKEDIISKMYKEAVNFPDFMSISPYIHVKYHNEHICDTAYHYTDIGGFKGIIGDSCFWATNTHFQNDSMEFNEGLDKTLSILKNFEESSQVSTEKKYFIGLMEELKSGFSSRVSTEFSSEDVFTISFCESGDLLSLWRGYGNSSGISIGFDRKELFNSRFKEKGLYEQENLTYPKGERIIALSSVIYDNEAKENILKDIIEIGIKFLKSNEPANIDVKVDLAVSGVSSSLFTLFPLFKDRGFEDERELRYIEQFTKQSNVPVHFRERNNILLPYVKLKMLDMNCQPFEKLPIKEIIVSPSKEQPLVIDSIKYYLKKSGFDYLLPKVKPSNIPYRG